jgi:hypothetical protein
MRLLRRSAGVDTYDADANTVSSGGNTNSYDFENRLVERFPALRGLAR